MKYDPEDWENYYKGIRLFNRKHFFEAHEAWEEIWKRTTDEEDKRFIQGLIQAAASFVHVERGNIQAAIELHDTASEKLQSFRQGYWGADIQKFLESFRSIREKIEKQEAIQDYPQLVLIKKENTA